MLYEMTVGRVPFSGDTPFAVIHDHIYAPLPLPSEVNPLIASDLERVLLKALAKDRPDRFKNVPELVRAFKEAWINQISTLLAHLAARIPVPEAAAVPPAATGSAPVTLRAEPEAVTPPSSRSRTDCSSRAPNCHPGLDSSRSTRQRDEKANRSNALDLDCILSCSISVHPGSVFCPAWTCAQALCCCQHPDTGRHAGCNPNPGAAAHKSAAIPDPLPARCALPGQFRGWQNP